MLLHRVAVHSGGLLSTLLQLVTTIPVAQPTAIHSVTLVEDADGVGVTLNVFQTLGDGALRIGVVLLVLISRAVHRMG